MITICLTAILESTENPGRARIIFTSDNVKLSEVNKNAFKYLHMIAYT